MTTTTRPGVRARKRERERVLAELLEALRAVMEPPDEIDPLGAADRFGRLTALYRQYRALEAAEPPGN